MEQVMDSGTAARNVHMYKVKWSAADQVGVFTSLILSTYI